MKFVIFALLLANVVMVGWLYRNGDDYRDMPTAAIPTASSVESLRLLSERTVADTSPESASMGEAASLPPTQNAVPAPQQVAPVESIDDAPVPESKPATVPAMAAQAATAATQATLPQHICQTVGPFAERKTVDAFAAKLSGLGPITAVRAAQVEQPSGYWVYLSAMPREDAQRIVADFEAKGVKDYFLGRQNFISLGVFADKLSAETRAQVISALGYPPRLEQRFLTREVYVVDVDELENAPVSQDQWAALLAEQSGIQRQPLTCK
jgi:hypothetical protein